MIEINDDIFKKEVEKQPRIEDYLAKDEKILWKDSPNIAAYTISQVMSLTPFALMWLLFDGFVIFNLISSGIGFPIYLVAFLVFFFALHLLPVWMWLSKLLTSRREKRGVVYFITNKRIIITDFEKTPEITQIALKDISDINLTKNGIDRLLKVGDIRITHEDESKFATLYDIKEPEKVYMAIEQIKAKFKNLANISVEGFNYTKPINCKYCGGTVKIGNKCPNCGANAKD